MIHNNILINVFNKIATSSRKVRNIYTPIGLIFFFTICLLFILFALMLDKLFNFPKPLPFPVQIIISIPVILIGIFLVLWSIFNFLRVRGTPVPFNPPPKLVMTGPYKYVRNPMLSGAFFQFFGLGILLNSISLFFIITPVFILFSILELKYVEEPELEKRLSKDYIEYKKKTPMFFPRFKK